MQSGQIPWSGMESVGVSFLGCGLDFERQGIADVSSGDPSYTTTAIMLTAVSYMKLTC